jgi:proteasome alpha subunit
MPFGYVSPEQAMKDRADFARKNVARGRPLVAMTCTEGIVLCAENPSRSLHKISEIYDRIAFAGVGKYSEFDGLRTAGVRLADITGYQYSREDVNARSLANAYGQTLNNVFTHEMKPLEVEILVAEVGYEAGDDQLFHILYDGTVVDEQHFSVLGGDADAIADRLRDGFTEGMATGAAVQAGVAALRGADRSLGATELEVAMLARSNGRRAFRRIDQPELESLLG